MTTKYIVVDKTGGKCVDHIRHDYGPLLANIVDEQKPVDGDAFVIRDILLEGGFEWAKDFYIKKVEVANSSVNSSDK